MVSIWHGLLSHIFFWGTLYGTVNIPYGSMASVMTADPVERTTLSTLRTMGVMFAQLIINAGGPLIIVCK